MDYTAWNRLLGNHFFGEDSGGRRVFFCITREILAGISGLSAEDALNDFVAAVLLGPDWNRIRGCTLLETKVHCCVYVDPRWGMHRSNAIANPRGVRELHDLSAHIHWSDYGLTRLDEEHPDRYPPYLAYLAAFVLAWTERDASYNGHDYYGPLLALLGGENRWPSKPVFGRKYLFKGSNHTINDVWADLRQFCEGYGRAELILPNNVLRPGHYVDTPKFFGLMKASDLRNLDKLFASMEEGNMLDPDAVPPARELVRRVSNSPQAAAFLTNTCLHSLGHALEDNDPSLAEAYGRLLQSKYRDFDGLSVDEEPAQAPQRRRAARLLRVMGRNGAIKVVCRLRSEGALKKLAIEEGVNYAFSGGGIEASADWIPGTAWFSTMEVPMDDPMGNLELQCPSLRIRAYMPVRDFIVLHNPGLYFLAGCKVEVEQLERGRQYVVLMGGTKEPPLSGIQLAKMNVPCPQDMSCWSFIVPPDATSDGWPEGLPPLLEERVPRPRLSYSGFRLEPRTHRFPVGLPVRIRCSMDNVELVATGIEDCAFGKEDDGIWVLSAHQQGNVTLSLRNLDNNQTPEGWQDQTIQFEPLRADGAASREFASRLINDAKDTNLPPYPEAWIELEGGVCDPRKTDDGAKCYFERFKPTFKIRTRNVADRGFEVILDGRPCSSGTDRKYGLSAVTTRNAFPIKVRAGSLLLCSLRLRFTPDPHFQVGCASPNRNEPFEVYRDSLVARIWGDDGMLVDWEVRSGTRRLTGGQIAIGCSGKGYYEGELVDRENAGIEAGKTYQVRFGFGGTFTVSRWFCFRKNRKPQEGGRHRHAGNQFNSMENAFKDLVIPVKKEGTKR